MKKIHSFVVLAYKESEFLEDCICSVLNQKYKSEVIIATSTPNFFIKSLAKKYDLKVYINNGKSGIGYDFDFAISCAKTALVTIAHQDDIYDYEYSHSIISAYEKNLDSLILFSDYYEIKNGVNVHSNRNLKIKRLLITPLKFKILSGTSFAKRLVLSFGDSICCPAVTFVRKKTGSNIFESDMKCDIDWLAWERLSKKNGKFIFVNKHLMGHRVHENSTTSEILKNDERSNEDYQMYRKFWPDFIAKKITKLYKNSEKSNSTNK